MLDVQQIFWTCRPASVRKIAAWGIIVTSHDKLAHYLGMLTHQLPIESQFVKGLVEQPERRDRARLHFPFAPPSCATHSAA